MFCRSLHNITIFFIDIFFFLSHDFCIGFLLNILFVHFFYYFFNIQFLRMTLVELVEDKRTVAMFVTRAFHWTVKMWMDKISLSNHWCLAGYIFISSWLVHRVMGSP